MLFAAELKELLQTLRRIAVALEELALAAGQRAKEKMTDGR